MFIDRPKITITTDGKTVTADYVNGIEGVHAVVKTERYMDFHDAARAALDKAMGSEVKEAREKRKADAQVERAIREIRAILACSPCGIFGAPCVGWPLVTVNPISERADYYKKMLDKADELYHEGTPRKGVWLTDAIAFVFACVRCKNVGTELCHECRCEARTNYEPKIAAEQDKPAEAIKLYCVRDNPGWLTKGKIYEYTPDKPYSVTYDNGHKGCTYSCLEAFHRECPRTGAPLWPLVKRPAKVGEWVLVVKPGKHSPHVGVNELRKIDAVYPHDEYPYQSDKNVFSKGEYLVLDGYKG
ncbi:MAG TPA: hypothetical protein VN512_13065 [Clostridia bacterium]|nr:hypothetical protein [Clostridia bacterium]